MIHDLNTYRLFKEQIIKETFFNKGDDLLDNLIHSIRNLVINCMYADKNDHKIQFFVDDLKICLNKYLNYLILKFTNTKKNNFIEQFDMLMADIDKGVLSNMKIDTLYADVLDLFNYDTDQIISKLEKIQELDIDKSSLIKLINDKIDKNVSIIKNIDTKLLKIEYNVEKYKETLYYLKIELLKLQEYVQSTKKKVLIIFDGRDAAGKGSCINMIKENLNPKYVRSESFDIPTKHESKHWFERYKERLPESGEIVIYDRSWYNRGYLEPALGYCSLKQYDEFMSEVNDFEKKIIDKDIVLIKLWLSVDKNVEVLRFELRRSDPLKYWKYSKNDSKVIKKWDEMSMYISKLLKSTNKYSKWNVINSNDKYKAEIVSMLTILKSINYDFKDNVLVKENIKNVNSDKYIFLDLDGVLIPFPDGVVKHADFDRNDRWSKESIELLNKLVEQTNAKIIISSSYRKTKTLKEIEDKLKEVGFKYYLHDKKLPSYDSLDRGKNIEKFLKIHKPENYVVIDDHNHDFKQFPNIQSNWIRPNTTKGFLDAEYKSALNILNK